MIGIRFYGAYVPVTRLPLALAAGRPAKEGDPERAVAAHDEDPITMAVAAAMDALADRDVAEIDALFLASTSAPFGEKSAAALVAKALDLRRDVATRDFGSSLRAGVAALVAARDAVAAGSARTVLVVAADARLAAPRSALERDLGDGAAAFVVSDHAVLAAIERSHAVHDEILDVWRAEGDPFLHAWEDRFVTQHGYHRNVVESVTALFEGVGLEPSEVVRAALAGPDARAIAAAARAIGLGPAAVIEPLFGKLGHTGAAFAPMLLVSALESGGLANGDRVLVATHGNGAEALLLRVAAASSSAGRPRLGLAGHLARRRALRSYDAYLASRHLAPTEHDPRGGAGVPATVAYRERDAELSLHAARCRRCATMHFPRPRVCGRCFTRDDFDAVRLAGRAGRVLSYTLDWFFPTPEPPTIAGVVEIDGARLYVQMTGATRAELRCDLPVEMVFRKIHEAGSRPNYFWKSTPLRADVAARGEPPS